jgi:hypothetical protein
VIRKKKMRLLGQTAQVGQKKNTYSVLIEKPEEKKSVGRHRHI